MSMTTADVERKRQEIRALERIADSLEKLTELLENGTVSISNKP
jgi:hypothetical protein